MKTELRRFVAVVSTLGLLASCAQTGTPERQSGNMSGAAQSTIAFAGHNTIVNQSENTAKEMAWHQKVLKAIIPLPRCTVRSETPLSKNQT
jgi:hypothetical protein